MGQARFSGGGGQYLLDIDAAVSRQEGNRSLIYWRTIVYKTGGSGYSGSDGGPGVTRIWPSGAEAWRNNGPFGYSFVGVSERLFADGTFWIDHDGNGNGSFAAEGSLQLGAIGYAATGSGTKWANRIPAAPGAPGAPSFSEVTPTTARGSWSGASRGHADIDQYLLRINTNSNPDAAGYRDFIVGGGTYSTVVTGLQPGTRYYAKTYAHNSDGYGPGSGTTSFTTAASSPPTLVSVDPTVDGTGARLTATPPAGSGSPSSYKFWRRTPGGAWVLADTWNGAVRDVTGLNPGQTYEWAVSVTYGSWESDKSNVISKTQPNPNTSPGAFFDGDTPDAADTNYAWTGTAGASTSTATTTAGGAVGWRTGAQAWATGGGAGYAYQITGSIVPGAAGGDKSLRYVATRGSTGTGFYAGPRMEAGAYAEVTEGGQYMGSMWVLANRTRGLRIVIAWYTNTAYLSTSTDATVTVQAGVATRLSILGTAPPGATRAVVNVGDVPGDLTISGDTLDVDGAMMSTGVLYPYFDGDTPDTTQFIYDWDGNRYTSISYRETVPTSEQDPLADPDCTPILAPPRPPIIDDPCITPVGSWRRYWVAIQAQNVPAWLEAVPTLSLTTGTEPERQVRVRWYPNPDNIPPGQFTGAYESEQIISYIPPCTEITLDGVSSRVYATVGVREGAGTAASPYQCVPGDYATVPADKLLYGTGGVPATWPVLECGVAYLVSLDVPLDSPSGNLTPDLGLTVRS